MYLRSSHWLGSHVNEFCDLNRDPNVGCVATKSSETKSFSPTLEMKTWYFTEFDKRVTQYSFPASR